MIGKILRKFAGKRIAVVGDLILDQYQDADVERISPEAPVPIVKIKNGSKDIRAGGAANVAINLVALGAEVSLFGVVGDDSEGHNLLEILKNHGIKTDGIIVDSSRPTTTKIRIISRNQQIIRIDVEETKYISKKLENNIKASLKENLKDLHAIIVEDYNKGLLTPGLIRFISSELTGNVPVGVDPKFENFSLYKNVKLFKPNKRELLGYTGKNTNNLQDAVVEVFKKIHPDYLMVTLSKEGMLVFDGERFYKIPALRKPVYDVTGAGDTVISVAMLSLASGLDIVESAILSSIAAGIEVSKFGVAAVLPEELREEYKRSYKTLKESVETFR